MIAHAPGEDICENVSGEFRRFYGENRIEEGFVGEGDLAGIGKAGIFVPAISCLISTSAPG